MDELEELYRACKPAEFCRDGRMFSTNRIGRPEKHISSRSGHSLIRPMRRLPGIVVTVHLVHSPDVAAGSSLHRTGRMSVGVVVEPPDESFHRPETALPDFLSPSALSFRPRFTKAGA